jgi:hypothetical protein
MVRFAVIFSLTALVTGSLVQLQEQSFVQAQLQTQSPSGPATGDTLNLEAFRSRSGASLARSIKGRSLAMVVFVDPNCTACTNSRDSFRSLRERVAEPGIAYYVLMLAEGDRQSLFAYADSLKLDAEAFVWSTDAGKLPASLGTMALPSHLLITTEGLIVNKWLGTPQSTSMSESMVNQTTAESVKHLRSLGSISN